MKKYEIKIKVIVSDNWIDDGADFTSDQYKDVIEENIRNMLPYATENEIAVFVTSKKIKP